MDHFTANGVRMRENKPPPPAAPQWATPLWCLGGETDRQPHWSQQWGSSHATSYWQPSHLLIACSTFALLPVCICVCVAMQPLMHIINHTYCQALAALPSTQQECVSTQDSGCALLRLLWERLKVSCYDLDDNSVKSLMTLLFLFYVRDNFLWFIALKTVNMTQQW